MENISLCNNRGQWCSLNKVLGRGHLMGDGKG